MDQPKQDKKSPAQGSGKLRGRPKDDPKTRISKTLSYVLRHGAKTEGIPIRPDGYVRVKDLLASPKFSTLDLATLQAIVKDDSKQRYHLKSEGTEEGSLDSASLWIRANQGHSLKQVEAEGTPILKASEVPMAVHGTNKKAWESISKEGLSRMTRNHIHFAQGLLGQNIVSGMRQSAEVFIYIDIQKAIDAGYKFELSANGVVLTPGNERGFLPLEFFQRVEQRVSATERKLISGWEGNLKPTDEVPNSTIPPASLEQHQKQLAGS